MHGRRGWSCRGGSSAGVAANGHHICAHNRACCAALHCEPTAGQSVKVFAFNRKRMNTLLWKGYGCTAGTQLSPPPAANRVAAPHTAIRRLAQPILGNVAAWADQPALRARLHATAAALALPQLSLPPSSRVRCWAGARRLGRRACRSCTKSDCRSAQGSSAPPGDRYGEDWRADRADRAGEKGVQTGRRRCRPARRLICIIFQSSRNQLCFTITH